MMTLQILLTMGLWAASIVAFAQVPDTIINEYGRQSIGQIVHFDESRGVTIRNSRQEAVIPWYEIAQIRTLFFPSGYQDSFQLDEFNNYYIQRVITLPDYTQDEIFTLARAWYSVNFNDANEVLDMEDRHSGILIGRGFEFVYGTNQLYYSVKIECRPGRYRYTIFDIDERPLASNSTIPIADRISAAYRKNGELRPVNSFQYQYALRPLMHIQDLHFSLSNLVPIHEGDDW